MFIGFNLELNLDKDKFDNYYKVGKFLYNDIKVQVKNTLDIFILKDGSLNGSKMQDNWFPQIKSDVFISHSHKDKITAIILAGILSEKFGLDSFIDSCIWGYTNDLLKIIDNKYCYNKDSDTYNYKKRNYSTSHVHMMLSTALTMMIDKTECLFFLNTPNSITASGLIEETESPWIYSEIAITQMIRKKYPREYKDLLKSASLKEDLKIKYSMNLKHLVNIDNKILTKWLEYNNEDDIEPLDILYKITNIKKVFYE